MMNQETCYAARAADSEPRQKQEKVKFQVESYDGETQEKRRKHRVVTGRILVAVFLFVGWEFFTRIGWMDSYYWSCPSMILQTAWLQLTKGTLLQDIIYTSGSTLIGFVSGTLVGALLGLSFWWSKTYAGISEPFIIILNALPKLALGPVLVILFGIGFFSKAVLAFLMTVVTSAISAYGGVKSVDPALETLMVSLGAKRRQVFAKVVVPWSMPWIISSLRINIALALAGSIVGEFISSEQGVGRMIIYAGTILDINLVWVGVFVLSVLSILMYWGVILLEKWLSKRLAIISS
jgi:NitT/TauT family transport system permease protein